jgi:hypothetical protein
MSPKTACAFFLMALLFTSCATLPEIQATKSNCAANTLSTPQSLLLFVQGSSIKAEWQAPEAADCISYYQGA